MTKILQRHLDRLASVYVRQSSLAQVQHHRESTARQYQLRERAVALGWTLEQIEVIDEDQGQSGASAGQREGFQGLLARVALGLVGAVLVLEVSRLARSCSDWYRLLEVAALSSTLIIDDDGVYDPNHYNDRLLLGLKGTLSEAELHLLKSRMIGGRRNKARRGAFRIRLPAGYVWDEGIRFDPDERVREAVGVFFRCFERLGSASAVARYFEDSHQPFPRRNGFGSLAVSPTWGPLSISRAADALRSPLYAGVYAYDRHAEHPEDPEEPAAGGRIWIADSHPAYISLEQYDRNVARLVANRNVWGGLSSQGSAREGRSLLQGIVLCARCGRRMHVRYQSDGSPVYGCRSQRTHRRCQLLNGRHVDPLIEERVLKALSPQELELAAGALEQVASRARELERQWQKRLEAAHYEAEKAARRYHQVEPENRLVARTLESEWNARLEELQELEREYDSVQKQPPLALRDDQRARILALAQDVPRLWRSATTTQSQRKEVTRLLVEDVSLEAVDEPWSIEVSIHWKTGAVTRHRAQRVYPHPHTTDAVVVEQIVTLSQERKTDADIAQILNTQGYRTGTGKRFTEERAAHIRYRHRQIKRGHQTPPEVLQRVGQLFERHTDAELARILNAEGYRPCAGDQFTAKIVFHLRNRQGLKKPGPRGLPLRSPEIEATETPGSKPTP